jgi:hypothetical protein
MEGCKEQYISHSRKICLLHACIKMLQCCICFEELDLLSSYFRDLLLVGNKFGRYPPLGLLGIHSHLPTKLMKVVVTELM